MNFMTDFNALFALIVLSELGTNKQTKITTPWIYFTLFQGKLMRAQLQTKQRRLQKAELYEIWSKAISESALNLFVHVIA